MGAGYTYADGEEPAVAGATITIHRGEFVAVVGANGSGKSTLARLCNGLLLPTEGEVRVAGRPTSDPDLVWEARRRVGMVFQNPDNQLVAATVEEDVAFGPENLGLAPDEIGRRVERSLAMVGLVAHRHRPSYSLSGGQKQLLAVAGVLAMEPDCLVLDEATSMLDPKSREQLVAVSRRLCREQGVAVMLITHHMDEVAGAHRVIALERGRIVFDGSPAALFAEEALIQRIGLDLPPLARIARGLAAGGLDVPRDCQQVEDLVNWLCR